MQQIWRRFAQDHTVTIWGMGYLGYTEALRFQTLGFIPVLWDYLPSRLEELRGKVYPDSGTKAAWNLAQPLAELDVSRVIIAQEPRTALRSSVHLVCMPAEDRSFYQQVRNIMQQELLSREDALVLFLSATSPGFIDSNFTLGPGDVRCGIATAFRQDWYFEEMLADSRPRVVGANTSASTEMARQFFDMLQLPAVYLSSIKSAEIMAHAQQLMQDMSSTFVNQLALTFPDTDIREIAPLLFQRQTPRLQVPSLGQMDVRQVTALRHLSTGLGAIEQLSLAQETQRASLSLLLTYADHLLACKTDHAVILGLSPLLAAQRDPRMSPPLILADYLNQHGVRITVHDPSYDADSLNKLLPYATVWNLDAPVAADAVLIMRDIPSCRMLTQVQLEELGITKARIVLDNTGIFRFNDFPDSCFYHVPGDGKLHTLGN